MHRCVLHRCPAVACSGAHTAAATATVAAAAAAMPVAAVARRRMSTTASTSSFLYSVVPGPTAAFTAASVAAAVHSVTVARARTSAATRNFTSGAAVAAQRRSSSQKHVNDARYDVPIPHADDASSPPSVAARPPASDIASRPAADEVARLAAQWHVPAHGPSGKLVDLLLTGEALSSGLAAASGPDVAGEVVLSKRQVCDLELLVNGGFSPLEGFMDQRTYDSVVTKSTLPDGTLFPMPITLDINEQLAAALEAVKQQRQEEQQSGRRPLLLVLKDAENTPLSLLDVSEMWRPDKTREAMEVFGGDPEHPAVVYLHNKTGPVYVSGRLSGLRPPVHYDHADLRRTPLETRAEFVRRGWSKVVAFQTRNPLHRAHFELTVQAAREHGAALLLHPVVGQTKSGDIEHHVRVKCYRAIMERYPEAGVDALLSALPLAMRMGGPREAVWHALIRQNYGATHFVLGRDHAGPGANSSGKDFYPPFAARDHALSLQHLLPHIRVCPFDMMVYLPAEQRYIGEGEVAPGALVEKLSGTEVRHRLNTGAAIPEWFSFPEMVRILRQAHPPLSRRGFCVLFTGLSGSGKSTIANALMERLLSLEDDFPRPVRLLDGDVVRQMLSSELGFSEEHRNLNVQRIGYVASLMVSCGGAVVAAPIAPYAHSRALARAAVEKEGGGGFLEVHVDTPLEECERRDRKGLYRRVRAGTLKHFTGVDDPYERPLNPDVHLQADTLSVQQSVDKIIDKLASMGYIKPQQRT